MVERFFNATIHVLDFSRVNAGLQLIIDPNK